MKKKVEQIEKEVRKVDKKIEAEIAAISKELGNVPCYHLSLNWCHRDIGGPLVDDVFDELRGRFQKGNNKKLAVIVSSSGGDIDAAYNLAMLFRRYGEERLVYLVPRWAKSAATLLVCGGDQILMSPVAELGPLDPQITASNPLEKRIENFSPLHIKATLDLINEQYKDGKKELADALMKRLQYPLTLGSYKKSLDVGKTYVSDLLQTRMLAGKDDLIESIATKLTEGYVDHGATILCREVKKLGLIADEMAGKVLDAAWSIHKQEELKHDLFHQSEKVSMQERLRELPPELLDSIKLDIQEAESEERPEK